MSSLQVPAFLVPEYRKSCMPLVSISPTPNILYDMYEAKNEQSFSPVN